ncbi:MAG TPA: hypothetical protein VMT24_12215 [Aggregatilineaceae bacterium]|jgi:hypothetical protein|nr:hypothetical protein [Aggregatilineaceae bacterium]
MSHRFEDQYLDVLQNIEAAIVQVYRKHPELADSSVDQAMEGLVRMYQAEARGRSAPVVRLHEPEQQVYDGVKMMCDWRMGRAEEPDQQEPREPALPPGTPKTVDEIVACLKRIRKSIVLWTKQGGRQGYLDYITQFIA